MRDWQIDNEYGCHDTVVSYSDAARHAFRDWCEARYGTIDALNAAWGNVFWSMDYAAFADIDPPNATVTEPAPAHKLDWRRFSSDQVMRFHAAQASRVREHAPGARIIHNSMGFFTEYDHRALARDLDAMSWDSYPLGFLDTFDFPAEEKRRWCRTGHPDVAAFHHDRYRGVGPIPFGIMEQQPGPVNWAAHNPAPLDGMVRFWTLEAYAHGADFLAYFRWRQCPFAQEQMHAGLNLPDNTPDHGFGEVEQVVGELASLGGAPTVDTSAPVALLFDEETVWAIGASRQGREFDPQRLAFLFYTALRRLGLDVDVVGPDTPLGPRALVVVPCLPILRAARLDAIEASGGHVLFGPRSGSKTANVAIPPSLAPGLLGARMGFQVPRVESLPPGIAVAVAAEHAAGDETVLNGALTVWREHPRLDGATVLARTADGVPALLAADRFRYLAGWPDEALLDAVVASVARAAGLATVPMPDGMRLRRRGELVFAFHTGPGEADVPAPPGVTMLLGTRRLAPGAVAAWREQ